MRIVQSTNIEAFKLTFEVLTGEFFVEVDVEDSEDEDWELCDLTQVEEDLEELDVEQLFPRAEHSASGSAGGAYGVERRRLARSEREGEGRAATSRALEPCRG